MNPPCRQLDHHHPRPSNTLNTILRSWWAEQSAGFRLTARHNCWRSTVATTKRHARWHGFPVKGGRGHTKTHVHELSLCALQATGRTPTAWDWQIRSASTRSIIRRATGTVNAMREFAAATMGTPTVIAMCAMTDSEGTQHARLFRAAGRWE